MCGGNNFHSESLRDAPDLLADPSVADNSNGQSGQLDQWIIPIAEVRAFTPAPVAHRLSVMSNAVGKLQQKRDRCLCDRIRSVGRHIGYDSSTLLRCLSIYDVKSR